MGIGHSGRAPKNARRSWILISLLGVLMLAIPLYDIWEDVSRLSWSLVSTLVENLVLLLLSLGLVYAGIWIARQDWDPEYKWTVTKWNLGLPTLIALMYGVVILLQLWVMGRLKPWILALDGILFGAVAAFGVGTYNATQEMAQDRLKRSREEYRTLTDDVLDNSDVATLILDDEFRIVWINQVTERYFDLARSEVIGEENRRLIDEHIADRFENPDQFRERVIATYEDNTYTEEFECRMRDDHNGRERWLQHQSLPIESGLYEGGRIEQYTDITDVKEREIELETRERQLRAMYDIISDASRTFEEKVDGLLGIGRELFDAEYGSFARIDQAEGTYQPEVVQAETADIEVGEIIPFAETHCQRMIEAEETIQFETRPFDVPAKEYGTETGFEMYVGTPVHENENVYGSLCFLDRTETEPFDDWQLAMVELMGSWMGYELNRKHLLEERQQQLRVQEAKFEEFVGTVDNYAIFTLDTDGLVTSWNRGAEAIKGYSEGEIVGESFEVFYPDEKVEAGLPGELLTEAKETGKAHHEGWRVRQDGTRFWADVTIAARYSDGDHVGYTKVVQDLTDQREYEQRLEHERERLEFLNRILRHNILNGLNLVDARATLLQDRTQDDPQAEEHLEIIRTRVHDLSSLIDTMRSFMSAVISDSEHETFPVAIRAQLEEKLSLARDSYPEAEFIAEDLPEESVRVIADDIVGEVFENVLSNAVIHNDSDTPRITIWSSRTDGADGFTGDGYSTIERGSHPPADDGDAPEGVVIHIADNGPGIPDEDKRAVLDKGVSDLAEPGNGFGLYLVKEMMEAYGGAVKVSDYEASSTGTGTEFQLLFQRAE